MSARLASQTQKSAGIPNGMRTATIAAVSGQTVTISVSGGQFSSGVGVLESYRPVVGDTVAVFRQDSSWLILGPTAAAPEIAPRAQATGTASVSFSAVNSATQAVSFGVTFASAPVVMTNIDSNAGVTGRWASRAVSITTTGFSILVFATDAVADTWSGIPVSWLATARE